MIGPALFLALQVSWGALPYSEMPRVDRESVQRCDQASFRLHQEHGNLKRFITAHEIDNGGRLNTEEAVVYRAMADNVAERYLKRIRFLQERRTGGDECERLSDEGKYALVNEVSGPLFGEHYGYYRDAEGVWRRSPDAGPIPRKN